MKEPSINELLALLSGAIENAGPHSPNDLDSARRASAVASRLRDLADAADKKARELTGGAR